MPVYYDGRGEALGLGRCLGRGGEGAVHALPLRPLSVAKIYARRPDDEQVRKLRAMIERSTPALSAIAAWPQGLVFDRPGGEVAGFVMPRVDGHRAIHTLYGPTDRASYFPDATWSFLVRAARNVAAAFATVHEHGHVLGDVNQGNVVVSAKATVRLIDCDSFQVSEDVRLYPCRVGVPLFTPPELQGRRLEDVVRTRDHDGFGLAVLVFHLLFMGRHPFAGLHPERTVTVEGAIREGLFVFAPGLAAKGWSPPPFSLRLADLPEPMAPLFESALARATATRPKAEEWVRALDDLERDLATCSWDARHAYFGKRGPCPWCRIEEDAGPAFFFAPPRLIPGTFDAEASWRAVESVRSPGPAAVPPAPAPIPDPNPPLKGRLNTAAARFKERALVVAERVAVYVLPAWEQSRSNARSQREKTVRACGDKVRDLERRWLAECGEASFLRKRQQLAMLKEELGQLGAWEKEDFDRLARTYGEDVMARHLRSFPIAGAAIPGLGPWEVRLLAQHGISTTEDLTAPALMAIPHVNLDLVSALLAYRQRVFTMIPDSSRAVPEPSLRALLVRQARRRKSLENDVRTGLTALTTLRRQTFARRKELARELTEAREDLEAAEAGRLVHNVAAAAPSPRKAPRFNLAPSPASVVPPATGVASNDASPWRLSLWIGVGWFAISSVMRTGTSYQRAIEDSPARERKPRVHTVPSPSASPPIKYGPAETPWAPRMRQAQSLAKDGKLTEARQAYEQLLETDAPRRFDLLLALASICTQLRDWRGAESAYSKAFTLRPDDAAVVQSLEKTYRRLGQPAKAEALVRRVASLADARRRVQSGLHLMASRQPAEGIALLRETTTLYPAYPEAYFYLGTALLGQDRIAESVPYLEKYVALSPDSEAAEAARNLLAGYKPQAASSK